MIIHIARPAEWEAAQESGKYAPAAYAHEGFIHACNTNQVKGVLERHFRGVTGLVLLHIDESRLTAPLVYEFAAAVNDTFPHIYGPINTDAVVETGFIQDQSSGIS